MNAKLVVSTIGAIVFGLSIVFNAIATIGFFLLEQKYLYVPCILAVLPTAFIFKTYLVHGRRNPVTNEYYPHERLMTIRQGLIILLLLSCAGVHGWYLFHSPVDFSWLITAVLFGLSTGGAIALTMIMANPSIAEALN